MAIRRLSLGLAALAAPILAAISGCASTASTETVAKDPMVGRLLVAAPTVRERLYRHTVILIVHHDDRGALGVMVNRPVEEMSLKEIAALMGRKDETAQGRLLVFAGGPVAPGFGLVVHSTDYRRPGTIGLDRDIAITSGPAILADIGQSKGPRKRLVAFGCTGWGPGELEIELARHHWFIEPEEPALVFDDDRDKLWEDALARAQTEL
ncbi:MAG TPA: YqgE/AlgH family protein [Dongiaceae bacterium]|nr:YqgE/AlgH family protein [Dongiaceae bacterium]